MKKNFYTAALTMAAAAALTACGGGGGDDVGSKVVRVDINEPTGVLEAGRLISVTGTASSSSGKLKEMRWTVSNSGRADSALTITNESCEKVTRSDSDFSTGSSNWTCTATLQVPKLLLAATTYELGLSASSDNYSGKTSRSITVKPASAEPNQVQVSISPKEGANRAGEVIQVNGVVSSANSRVTAAKWRVEYAGQGNQQKPSEVLPTLSNSECEDHTTNFHPAGQEAETWNCAVKMVVPPRLTAPTDYRLTLSGTNANGNTVTESHVVHVDRAVVSENKVSVELDPPPTSPVTLRTGDKISLTGTITTTNSSLKPDSASFGVYAVSPLNPAVGPNDAFDFTTVCREAQNPTQGSHTYRCTGQLSVNNVGLQPVTLTYFLTAVNDEEFSNYAARDIVINPATDAFGGIRANVSYSPTPVTSGSSVSLSCVGAGSSTGVYNYSWRVVDSGGTSINLGAASSNNGSASFTAPNVEDDTNVKIECGVSDGRTPAVWVPTEITIKAVEETPSSPFAVTTSAARNPIAITESTTLTCQANGGAPTTAGTYTYSWTMVENPLVGVAPISNTPVSSDNGSTITVQTNNSSGITGGTVRFNCEATDGTITQTQGIDLVVNGV